MILEKNLTFCWRNQLDLQEHHFAIFHDFYIQTGTGSSRFVLFQQGRPIPSLLTFHESLGQVKERRKS